MGFLLRMTFWFSLVLLLLPLDPSDGDGTPGVNPLQAFFAAKQAVDDVAGICERQPEVCEVGKAAMQTIGARAKEGARMAFEMLDENGTTASINREDVEGVIDTISGASISGTTVSGASSETPAIP